MGHDLAWPAWPHGSYIYINVIVNMPMCIEYIIYPCMDVHFNFMPMSWALHRYACMYYFNAYVVALRNAALPRLTSLVLGALDHAHHP